MKLYKNDRLLLFVATLFFVAFGLLALFVVSTEFRHIEMTFDNDLLNTARIIATDEELIDKLMSNDDSLNDDVSEYYIDVPEIGLIVITDTSGTRYSHTDESLIGEKLNQNYYQDALSGNYLYNTSDSIIGLSRKVYVPMFHDQSVIGVAIVSIPIKDITTMKWQKATTFIVGFGIGYIFLITSMLWLRRRFKSVLFGFDPSVISLLYAENRSVIEQLNEALISIDNRYLITTINETAEKMFGISKLDIGKPVGEVFPYVDFEYIIEHDQHLENKYKKIDELKLLMNAFPLYLENETIGATAIFRSHLEVDTLVDQIQGYQQIAKALRSQKHEFQNKLHVVLGLIKMKDYEQAENYITEHVYTTNLASDYYTSRLKDERILALFIGKEIQSKEYGATLLLTSDSYIDRNHPPINSDDIVLVLGNLIDNSLEAYNGKDLNDKRIVVDILEDEDSIRLTVIDQAGGIPKNIVGKMFERGVSSKNGEGRGTGLSLVNEIVLLYDGEKHVNSSVDETKIEIVLMKVIV